MTLSWKVEDKCNVVQHVDIIEKQKPNPFSLGKELYIGEDKFEDLDEILARYVQPMATFARDILTYKYYMGNETGDRLLTETFLKEEKLKQSNRFLRFQFLRFAFAITYYIQINKHFRALNSIL